MMNKDLLVQRFNEAIEDGSDYIMLEFKLPGASEKEIIINGNKNFKVKKEFYINNYNDKLEHNNNAEVKILDVNHGTIKQLLKILEEK